LSGVGLNCGHKFLPRKNMGFLVQLHLAATALMERNLKILYNTIYLHLATPQKLRTMHIKMALGKYPKNTKYTKYTKII
jgi:hypothetical protein